MKIITCFLIAVLAANPFVSTLYNISFTDLDGNTIQLASFQNKKIVLAPFSAGAPEVNQLVFLDSLQKVNPSIKIIAFPAQEFAGPGVIQVLKDLRQSHSLTLLLASPLNASKTSGLNQHPLFKWLTDVNLNTHFDFDAEAGGQLFMVSPTGILYSVLVGGAPLEVINQSIQQSVN